MARAMKDSGIEWIGEIPEGWETVRLKDIKSSDMYAIVDGPFGTAISTSDYVEVGTPLVRIVNLDGDEIAVDNLVYITNEHAQKLLRSRFYKGDIIFAKTGATVGKCAINSNIEEGILSSSCVKIQIADNHYNRYFYYFFSTKQFNEALRMACNGTTRDTINLKPFSCLNCPLPPNDQQHIIADYLDNECARIDAVIEQTRASIEEYKKLKQSVITQAVTKGIRQGRRMVNSGVDWIGQIPDEWAVFRIANLYDERNERGTEDLPILTVSINTGISDHEIPDEEKDRVVVRSEDRTLYKRVCSGDLAYNMMRAWQGAFGAVRVEGMVSPAYVVAKPKLPGILDSRYVEALLRTPSAIEEMHRYSRGITDFRLRLYWPEFKNICVCVPSIREQIEIADYIDKKATEIDALIQKKQQFLVELESYKKILIFEYVTGKKEVR